MTFRGTSGLSMEINGLVIDGKLVYVISIRVDESEYHCTAMFFNAVSIWAANSLLLYVRQKQIIHYATSRICTTMTTLINFWTKAPQLL